MGVGSPPSLRQAQDGLNLPLSRGKRQVGGSGRFANRAYQKFGGDFRLDDAAGPTVDEDALYLFDEGLDVPAGYGGYLHGWMGRGDPAGLAAVGVDEVHLVEDEELGLVGEVKLVEGVFDDLDLAGAAGV